MKLITKNSLYFLSVMLLVFTIGSGIFYFQIHHIINEEACEELEAKKELFEKYVKSRNEFPKVYTDDNELKIIESNLLVNKRIYDTLLHIESEGEKMPFKQMEFNVSLNQKNYIVNIGKPMFEDDDLVETIVVSLLQIVIILIILLFALNYLYSKIIWKPFHQLLEKISRFDVTKDTTYKYKKLNTQEFNELSLVLEQLTCKIKADFENLKAFTENASHELQTPLAVIRIKTEQLMQAENLTEHQHEQIYAILQTAHKLSKLNQTLLLLSKIENKQFDVSTKINFTEALKTKIEHFDELIRHQKISLTLNVQPEIMVSMHADLADILISNLISNAVKHSGKPSVISITLNSSGLIIENSGIPLEYPVEKLFERFFKTNQSNDSTGLGLAIVKQIADANNHHIKYAYENFHHKFTYQF